MMSFGMRPSSILHTWPSQRSRLWVSMAYMLGRPARDRTSAFVMRSCQVMPRSRLKHVKGIQPAFLAGVEGPCLTTVEKGAQYAGLVHLHLCVDGQQGIVPNSLFEASHCCCCFSYPNIELRVQG